jgi:hypothetical protein
LSTPRAKPIPQPSKPFLLHPLSDVYDALYRNAVYSAFNTIYGLEGAPYNIKFYFLTPTTLEYRPTMEYYRSATEKVTYDKDYITQDMINFVIRLAEKNVVKLDTTAKYE